VLKERIEKYLKEQGNNIYIEEKEYAEKHQLITEGDAFEVRDPDTRFTEAYIERGDKETEEVLGRETADFLNKSIEYFKRHINEFMYLESQWFEIIGADAISFEVDDLFRTYDVMLGLKLPKKKEAAIRSYMERTLQGDSPTFDLMFNQQDGLWDLNFALDNIQGFREDLTIGNAYLLIYTYLFHLVETVEAEIKSM
jgi:hypothetical protein